MEVLDIVSGPMLVWGDSKVGKLHLLLSHSPQLVVIDLTGIELKALLGTYIITKTGFEWRHGPLTTCVLNGIPVVFVGVAAADQSVLAGLSALLETGILFVAQRNIFYRAQKGFRCFATFVASRVC